ncbi:Inositol-1-monophosphatase [Plasmodiophora brassicae]
MADEDAAFTLALQAAKDAGQVIVDAFHKRDKSIESKSGATDLVTVYDRQCEELIVGRIRHAFPTAKIIAEESHADNGYDLSNDMTWFVDPIDGTNNFIHGIPWTCVSIGCHVNRKPAFGIVYNPIINELFTARAGQGAFLNGRQIRVSNITKLDKAAVINEFGYGRDPATIDRMLGCLRKLLTNNVQSVRFFGSAALNMCSVACGRADVYFEGHTSKIGPKPWDFAAAEVVLTEAGGVISDQDGGTFDMTSGRVLCASSKALLDSIVDIMK